MSGRRPQELLLGLSFGTFGQLFTDFQSGFARYGAGEVGVRWVGPRSEFGVEWTFSVGVGSATTYRRQSEEGGLQRNVPLLLAGENAARHRAAMGGCVHQRARPTLLWPMLWHLCGGARVRGVRVGHRSHGVQLWACGHGLLHPLARLELGASDADELVLRPVRLFGLHSVRQ